LQISSTRNIRFFLFSIISLLYIVTRVVIFKGFNGTDDLHYAMLASNILKGTYNPFTSGDIFSGRVLLVAWQALIYKVGGINIFTTQAGTLFAVLLSCYLTIFKLLQVRSINAAIIGASLFYFSPVLTNATKGTLPDIYVVLAGIIVLLLWNKTLQQTNARKNILNGAGIGFTIAACMLVKETALVFFVLIACLAFFEKTRQASVTCLAMIVTLLICGSIMAGVYYHYTGDALYRLQQVQNSNYYNPCSYDILPASFLITRLTYGIWKEFITYGFYPVLFSVAIIVYRLLVDKNFSVFRYKYIQYFIILLVTGLYFPFSIKGYQPLCSDTRHFLFLLPLGVCISTQYITDDIEKGTTIKWVLISILSFIACMLCTPDKWQWMLWCLFILFFIAQKFISPRHIIAGKAIAFAAILWLCMPYYLFYNNSNWFAGMRQLDKQLTGNHYYFADHDNMMHWELLHQFNDSIHCYDMDAYPFKIFQLYYERLDTTAFYPGWLLVNKTYTERSEGFLHTMDSLQKIHYFNRRIANSDIDAYYIQQPAQLSFIKNTVENDVKVMR